MSVFENLVGQEHVVEIIKSAVAATRTGAESQEMTHAWVFTGPPGSGRSPRHRLSGTGIEIRKSRSQQALSRLELC